MESRVCVACAAEARGRRERREHIECVLHRKGKAGREDEERRRSQGETQGSMLKVHPALGADLCCLIFSF